MFDEGGALETRGKEKDLETRIRNWEGNADGVSRSRSKRVSEKVSHSGKLVKREHSVRWGG